MFNKNLIKTLSVLNPITNSIVLNYPITCGVSEDHSICFKFSVEKIDNSEFNEINLNDFGNKLPKEYRYPSHLLVQV